MILNTTYHGAKEYEEKDIIKFNNGIPGFENLKHFIHFSLEENEFFSIIHSIEDLTIGLVVVSPFYVMKDYEIDLNDEMVKALNIENSKDVTLLNTVSLNSDISKITVNMRAPIVINIKSRLGEQIILNDEKYLIKQPLFKEE
jgi:flagellar assembly factor FliW